MPSILVVEQEDRYVERIRAALSVEGWRVRIVPSADQAIQAAASEAPDLVLVSAQVPAAATLAGAFSRSGGGPGVVGLLAEGAAFPAPGFAPDDLLAKPFTDEALRAAAHRALGSRPAAASPQGPGAKTDHKLTSHEIFGDVLDEVEGPRPPAAAPPPRPPRGRHHRPAAPSRLRRTTRCSAAWSAPSRACSTLTSPARPRRPPRPLRPRRRLPGAATPGATTSTSC